MSQIGPDDILLRFKGDASGVQQAAGQAASAVQQVEQAAARAADARKRLDAQGQTQADTLRAFGFSEEESVNFAAQRQTADALEGVSRTAGRASEAVGKAAGQLGGAEASARKFQGALRLLSPEMALLANLADDAGQALGYMFTPVGLGITAATAALVGMVGLIQRIERQADQATAANERLAGSMRKTMDAAALALGRRGVTSEDAIGKARAIQERLVGEGLTQEAVAAVVPLAFDRGGQQVLTEEEIRRAAVLKEIRPEAISERTRPASIQRRIDTERNRPLIDAYLKALQGVRRREQEAMAAPEAATIRERLARGPRGLPEDQLDQAVADIVRLLETGDVGTQMNPLSPSELVSVPMDFGARQRLAVDRALALGLIGQQQAAQVRERGFWGATGRDIGRGFGRVGRWFGLESPASGWPKAPAEQAATAPPADLQPASVPSTRPAAVSNNYYGPVYHDGRVPSTVNRTEGM